MGNVRNRELEVGRSREKDDEKVCAEDTDRFILEF